MHSEHNAGRARFVGEWAVAHRIAQGRGQKSNGIELVVVVRKKRINSLRERSMDISRCR